MLQFNTVSILYCFIVVRMWNGLNKECAQGIEEVYEKVNVAGVIDQLVWLILPGKWDILENIVEQEVLDHKREYPYDHQMGHKGFVNKVDRG